MRRESPNLQRIRVVARQLGPLLDRFVFVGGAVTELLVTDSGAPPPRATLDVDVIVELASGNAFHELQGSLRRLGFREDMSEGAPICRWLCDGVHIDVMPTDERWLGFSNRWYGHASRTATQFPISGDAHIRLVSAPSFLATKLEAFHGRGNRDYLASHDLEDIVAVLDGRESIVREIDIGNPELRQYLSDEIHQLLADSAFVDALGGHLPPESAGQARLPSLVTKLNAIVELSGNSRA